MQGNAHYLATELLPWAGYLTHGPLWVFSTRGLQAATERRATAGEAMANQIPVATADQFRSPDGSSGDQPIPLETDTVVVPVPENQPVDEHAANVWFQQQQARFAARFRVPSFRFG